MRIKSIRIEHILDDLPDLSYLGEYTDKYVRGAIDRKAIGDMGRNEYQYFIPYMREGGFESYQRYEQYNKGYWCSIGVVAIAEIEKRIGNKVISFEISSDGIYGIESDAEDYIEEIDQEELNNLRYQLSEIGLSMIQLDKAFNKNIDIKDVF